MYRVFFWLPVVLLLPIMTGCTSLRLTQTLPQEYKSSGTINLVQHEIPFSLEKGNGAGHSPAGEKKNEHKENGEDKHDKEEKEEKETKSHKHKALFEWAHGSEKHEQVKGEGAHDEEERIDPDRPHFTPPTATVPKGKIQVETGYTYFHNHAFGESINTQNAPEVLVRFGLWTDWLEGFVGQKFIGERSRTPEQIHSEFGAEDLELGVRIALTEQKGWLPETGAIVRMSVPSGSSEFSNQEVLPGGGLFATWKVKEWTFSGGTFVDRARDGEGHFYTQVTPSFIVIYDWHKKIDPFVEWFALLPAGAEDPRAGPQQYFHGGVTYFMTNNLTLDVHAGVGLNQRSDDYFAGAGFSFRF